MLARSERPVTDPATQAEMLAVIPQLRAFAISLCGNMDRADDLVQEAMLRALANIDSFQPGTNMSAWLFTILRNHFMGEYRKRKREVEDVDGAYSIDTLAYSAGGEHDEVCRLDWGKMQQCMSYLPSDRRHALELVAGEGFSYDDAAAICGVAVGTIKSRVNRARTELARMLEGYQLVWLPQEEVPFEEVEAWGRIVGSGATDDFILADER